MVWWLAFWRFVARRCDFVSRRRAGRFSIVNLVCLVRCWGICESSDRSLKLFQPRHNIGDGGLRRPALGSPWTGILTSYTETQTLVAWRALVAADLALVTAQTRSFYVVPADMVVHQRNLEREVGQRWKDGMYARIVHRADHPLLLLSLSLGMISCAWDAVGRKKLG